MKYNKNDKFVELRNEVRDEKVREQIRKEYSLTIQSDKQGKHLRGSKTFIEGRSEIYLSIEECQEIVEKFSLTGKMLYTSSGEWNHKEQIKTDKIIGCAIDKDGNRYDTHYAIIHYAKTGTHIVPRREI